MIRVHAAGPVRWICPSARVRSDRIHAVSNHTVSNHTVSNHTVSNHTVSNHTVWPDPMNRVTFDCGVAA